jgi:hypothetical protein
MPPQNGVGLNHAGNPIRLGHSHVSHTNTARSLTGYFYPDFCTESVVKLVWVVIKNLVGITWVDKV